MNASEALEIVRMLAVKADDRGMEALSEHEKNIVLPWSARGIIGNGGFKYFFEGSHPLSDVSQRFRALGLERVARSCDEVLVALFGHQPEIVGQSEREAGLGGIDWDRFEAHEDVVFELKWEELLDVIGAYIDRFPEAFADVRAWVREKEHAIRKPTS